MVSYIKSRHQDDLQLVPLPKALGNGLHETVHTRISKIDYKKVGLDPIDRVPGCQWSSTNWVLFLTWKWQQKLPYSSKQMLLRGQGDSIKCDCFARAII
jgi:hypothetical protein